MTLRDLSALRPTDLDVLELLRADRDGDAVGVPAADVAAAAGTRWPDGVIRRLCRHRYVIGLMDGRYLLGHDEPSVDVAGAPDAGRSPAPGGVAPAAPATCMDAHPTLFEIPAYREVAA
jgi:hypothetical protein